jgi:ParB family transcriptional regulator, chromosome partitioning protein
VAIKKKGLGRGLGALIGEAAFGTNSQATATPAQPDPPLRDGSIYLELDPRDIKPNPQQPRTVFDEEALQELADSIRLDGLQEPVIVRRKDHAYELVSGERRVRASIMADIETVPAICRDVSDADMLKLGLIENIQREDLNPMECARAYHTLMEAFAWTQEVLAQQVGKKRATVANTLRLLNLPADVQRYVEDGSISMGHARALLALESQAVQRATARKIVDEGLSVRQVEKMGQPQQPKEAAPPAPKDPNVAHVEDELRRVLGTKVTLKADKSNRGKIEIEFYTLDDLERILAVLRR